MYKRNGLYYILATQPASAEYTLKASNPFGPYTIKNLVKGLAAPGGTNGGNPHQGGIVDTPSGQWYYMAFIDLYPGGRVPVLAPVTWGSDGFPAVTVSAKSNNNSAFWLTRGHAAGEREMGRFVFRPSPGPSRRFAHWRRLLCWFFSQSAVGVEPQSGHDQVLPRFWSRA